MISIDWGTKIITVNKADMTLVQSSPTVIYELDLNAFRLTLKDLEDDEAGIPHLDTHNHNTEVDVGGLTLARVVEIINGYTVTFEDDQYAVNLVGANSNVGDVINVNQVSVRSFNSAGMISSPAIEYASFNGGVTVDTTSGVSGTVYNKGTPENPVDNIADAILIATTRGFNTIYIIGDITLTTGDNLDNYIIVGENTNRTTITLESGASIVGSEFRDATISGVLDGGAILRNCIVDTIQYVDGIIYDSMLEPGDITLSGIGIAHFVNCFSGTPGANVPVIDMNGSGTALALRNYNGGVKLTNKTGSDAVIIDMNSGQLLLDPNAVTGVTAGTITVRGIGKVVNADTDALIGFGSTSFNSATIVNETVNPMSVTDAVWDEATTGHTTTGTTGEALTDAGASGNPWSTPVSGNTTPGTFGELVGKKLLTLAKFLGLK